MAEYKKVATLSEVPSGGSKAFTVGGAAIAVYNVDGVLFATDNECPHRGGPLGEGSLKGDLVTCPWHGFQYEVRTGACRTSPALKVACRPVKVEGQDVLVMI